MDEPENVNEFLELVRLAGKLVGRPPLMIEVPHSEKFVWGFDDWDDVLVSAGFHLRGSRYPWHEEGLHTVSDGVELISYNGEVFSHHRLLATLLVDELEELKNMDVTHENHVKWCNWLDNLELTERLMVEYNDSPNEGR